MEQILISTDQSCDFLPIHELPMLLPCFGTMFPSFPLLKDTLYSQKIMELLSGIPQTVGLGPWGQDVTCWPHVISSFIYLTPSCFVLSCQLSFPDTEDHTSLCLDPRSIGYGPLLLTTTHCFSTLAHSVCRVRVSYTFLPIRFPCARLHKVFLLRYSCIYLDKCRL